MADKVVHSAAPSEQSVHSGGVERLSQPANSRIATLKRWLGFKNISAVYIFVVVFAVFALTIPRTFLTTSSWRTLLDNQVITGLTAVALVIPLAAGAFNLAIGLQVGAGSIFTAWLLVHMGASVPLTIALAALSGVLIGVFTGFLIVRVHIDSFIATLGVSSLLAAIITGISGGQQILGVPDVFANFGIGNVYGITYSFFILIFVAAIVWYVLERTPAGRRVYATGGNIEAARLAGVNTTGVIFGSLMACGLIAAIAGMLVTARLGNADPTIGPGYLVPAFTAAFLGSTQFRGGRFNIWGTLLAAYVLATGVKGLQLSGAPVWIPDAFNGVSLLLAVGMAKYQGQHGSLASIRRILRMDKSGAAELPSSDTT
jgi:ribose transport system permease protein